MPAQKRITRFFGGDSGSGSSVSVSTTPPPASSRTSDQLKKLSQHNALLAWERLRNGYVNKSGSGYPSAANGYVQIAPIV
ncbi:hypothetical protein ACHAQJ_001902 [Trichoderma viride]